MRILLVEDDQKAARLLARGFREEGFVIDPVGSAEDADAAVLRNHYDLVILDWMLPGKDGLALCRTLRERSAHTPIIMLTARDALSDCSAPRTPTAPRPRTLGMAARGPRFR